MSKIEVVIQLIRNMHFLADNVSAWDVTANKTVYINSIEITPAGINMVGHDDKNLYIRDIELEKPKSAREEMEDYMDNNYLQDHTSFFDEFIEKYGDKLKDMY